MKNIFQFALLFAIIIGLAACEKMVEGLNDDPNNPDDAPAELMLTGATLSDVLVHEGELARLVGMWSGYFTGGDRQYIGYDNYNVTAGDSDSPWGELYAGSVAQCRIIQQKANLAKNSTLEGAAQILEAHAIGTATALWGDVPFSEVADVEKYPEPKFDAQLEVYAGLQTLLDAAIDNAGGSGFGDGSATTESNCGEIAHSLKARYYLHTGEYANAINAAEDGIGSPTGDWMALHGGSLNNLNVYYSFNEVYRFDYMTGQDSYLSNLLDTNSTTSRDNDKTDESARFAAYYYTYQGTLYTNFGFSQSFPLLTYTENQLIMAESHMRMASETDTATMVMALTNLNNVRANLLATYGGVYDAYTLADFSNGGVENPDGSMSMYASLLMEIIEEKYVSMYGQIEGYSDVRRTNNALGIPAKRDIGSSINIPERLIYPQSEINSNENVPETVDLAVPTAVNQ